MKFCVLGGSGQLGNELKKVLEGENSIFLSSKDIDITDENITIKILREIKPQLIIHAAAYTDVDRCEVRRDYAMKVNVQGTANIVKATSEIDAKLLYVSSDYVFDGNKGAPYEAYDKPNPINVYGKSKYLGEIQVENNLEKYYIVRTAGMYGSYGKSFVSTLLKLVNEGTIIKVINDQYISPTNSYHLAMAIKELITTDNYGKYHFVNEGSCTWYQLATAVCEIKKINAKLTPILSEEIENKAPRPKNSSMKNISEIKLMNWYDALFEFLY